MSKRQNHRKDLDIGITQTINQSRSFSGILKVRYSDFHVHEIDLTGRILHLTSSDLPPEETTVETLDQDSNLMKWSSEETAKKINALQNALDITGTDRQCQKVEINVTSANKDIRTKIHRWIGQFDNLQSETIDHDSEKLISVFRTSISDKKRCLRRPYNQAKYTHCVLYKEGLDTTDAISYLSRKLRMQPKYITFAGTKDKQAKTVQRICFSNVDAKRLLAINQYSTHSKLGNFSYQPSHIRLGDLKGNHFKILIRQVQTTSSDEISKAVNSLGDRGFINYYGLQRFGTFKIPTHLVGKALLQMDWLKV